MARETKGQSTWYSFGWATSKKNWGDSNCRGGRGGRKRNAKLRHTFIA